MGPRAQSWARKNARPPCPCCSLFFLLGALVTLHAFPATAEDSCLLGFWKRLEFGCSQPLRWETQPYCLEFRSACDAGAGWNDLFILQCDRIRYSAVDEAGNSYSAVLRPQATIAVKYFHGYHDVSVRIGDWGDGPNDFLASLVVTDTATGAKVFSMDTAQPITHTVICARQPVLGGVCAAIEGLLVLLCILRTVLYRQFPDTFPPGLGIPVRNPPPLHIALPKRLLLSRYNTLHDALRDEHPLISIFFNPFTKHYNPTRRTMVLLAMCLVNLFVSLFLHNVYNPSLAYIIVQGMVNALLSFIVRLVLIFPVRFILESPRPISFQGLTLKYNVLEVFAYVWLVAVFLICLSTIILSKPDFSTFEIGLLGLMLQWLLYEPLGCTLMYFVQHTIFGVAPPASTQDGTLDAPMLETAADDTL
eukprot:TRINITY_DN9839_c0_g1_i1.p1 TRINITY_DN9839_c0_g1~~TRINITY_DN9839_c0_g1_i1.p1  ORF type:complete len:431 (+),score=52.66 TRINITY_DN9839_c0_g1_i1:38-1294(+)